MNHRRACREQISTAALLILGALNPRHPDNVVTQQEAHRSKQSANISPLSGGLKLWCETSVANLATEG